jgi:MtN3 and saliva related transmembrane protein
LGGAAESAAGSVFLAGVGPDHSAEIRRLAARLGGRQAPFGQNSIAMIDSETLGYAAGTLTTVSFLPQAWLSWKTRHTAGLSVGMYSLFTLGVALWLGYGVLIRAWPVIVSNSITLALALFILGLRLRHGRGLSRHRRIAR